MPQPELPPIALPETWDLVAEAYAAEVVPMLETFARQALRLAGLPATTPHQHNARVLDVACGPGTLALLAAHGGYHVDALDFSPRMIEQLNARIVAENAITCAAHHGDGQQLPFGERHYAAAFSLFGLMFFPDRARGFRELARVLVPGGRAVIASWHPTESVWPLRVIFGALAELAGVPPREPPLTSADECEREMAAAGFTDITVHTFRHVEHHASPRALWDNVQRTFAPVAAVRARLGGGWAPIGERIADTLSRELGERPVALPLTAWLTVGTAPR